MNLDSWITGKHGADHPDNHIDPDEAREEDYRRYCRAKDREEQREKQKGVSDFTLTLRAHRTRDLAHSVKFLRTREPEDLEGWVAYVAAQKNIDFELLLAIVNARPLEV